MDERQSFEGFPSVIRWFAGAFPGVVEPYGDYFERLRRHTASAAPLRVPCR